MVSLLAVIDNPRQDIDLIGTMRSPLFGFSEQELAEIHLFGKSLPFYEAACLAAGQMPHVKGFLSRLSQLREFACDQPVYRLLWKIYDETNALAIYGAQPNGAQRQKNLLSFFERARVYEAQGFRGLFGFNRLLRGMMDAGEDFKTVKAESSVGAVRIMSIHKSKGLEFSTNRGCMIRSSYIQSLVLVQRYVILSAASNIPALKGRQSRHGHGVKVSVKSCASYMWR